MFCTENELQKSTGKHTLWKAHKFRNRDLGPRGSMPGRQVTCRGPTPRQRGTDHKAWFLSPDTQKTSHRRAADVCNLPGLGQGPLPTSLSPLCPRCPLLAEVRSMGLDSETTALAVKTSGN